MKKKIWNKKLNKKKQKIKNQNKKKIQFNKKQIIRINKLFKFKWILKC